MTKRLFCMWRLDGEFNITDINEEFKDQNFDIIIAEVIRQAAQNMGMSAFLNKEEQEKYINLYVDMAINPKNPHFTGYDMPMIILADPDNIEFIGA